MSKKKNHQSLIGITLLSASLVKQHLLRDRRALGGDQPPHSFHIAWVEIQTGSGQITHLSLAQRFFFPQSRII